MAPPPPAAPKGEKIAPPKATKEGASIPAPAAILVSLPAEAKLVIDGYVTSSVSANRVFTSPALEPGKEFSYTLKASIVRDGQQVTTTRTVPVRAGETTRVTLEFPVADVAQQ